MIKSFAHVGEPNYNIIICIFVVCRLAIFLHAFMVFRTKGFEEIEI